MKTHILSLIFLLFSLFLTACGGGDETAPRPVKPGDDGTISLQWVIPSTKLNGDALSLSEIGGYKIYLTTDSVNYPTTEHVNITNNTVTQHTITNLAAGTYYIYIRTYDVNGDESPYSEMVSTTI